MSVGKKRATMKSPVMRRKMYACRKRLQFSQVYVAEKVGITQTYYSLIENGLKTPSRLVMLRIAEVLKVKRWWELYDLQVIDNERKAVSNG